MKDISKSLNSSADSLNVSETNEQYFRPSKLKAINTKDFNYVFFDKYYKEDYNKIELPKELFSSPEGTLINYFSILREAENISSGGCGSIGNARSPYPISYKFLSSDYQKKLNYKSYESYFKDIGHINLVKLKDVTSQNDQQGMYKYFFEIEAIEPSTKGVTSFAYYYGFIKLILENGKYKINDIDVRGEDFLCAAYHGWIHNAELYSSTVYGDWCHLIKKIYPTEQEGYVKNIYIEGTDGNNYRFEFFQLTNGTDIEIKQYIKDKDNTWKEIHLDVSKCIKP